MIRKFFTLAAVAASALAMSAAFEPADAQNRRGARAVAPGVFAGRVAPRYRYDRRGNVGAAIAAGAIGALAAGALAPRYYGSPAYGYPAYGYAPAYGYGPAYGYAPAYGGGVVVEDDDIVTGSVGPAYGYYRYPGYRGYPGRSGQRAGGYANELNPF